MKAAMKRRNPTLQASPPARRSPTSLKIRHFLSILLGTALLCAGPLACSPDARSDGPDAGSNGGDAPSNLDTGSHIGPGGLLILSVSPNRGPLAEGDEVDIAGAGFFEDARVYFDAVEVEVTFRGGSAHLFVKPPPRDVPGRVDVRVENPGIGSAVVKRGYTYLGTVTVDSVQPDRGTSAGGTLITVKGSGFVPGDRILIGDRAAFQSEVIDEHTVVALTPALTLPQGQSRSKVTVSVRHASGVALAPGSFTYGNPPRVTSVEASLVPMAGGSVVLRGDALDNAETLYIDGNKAVLAAGDASSSRGATVPPATAGASPGAVDLLITGPFGHTVLSPALAYIGGAKPALFGVSPASGDVAGGETVHVLADLAGSKATQLRFGDTATSVQTKDGSLVAVVPAHVAGLVDLTLVTDKGELSVAQGFRYWQAPKLTKVSPATGPLAGGQTVVLSGKGLVKGCVVRIGSWFAKILDADAVGDTLQIQTPPGAAGPADVEVSCGTQTALLLAGYAYDNGGVQLDTLLPAMGASGGGTWVTLHGAGFDKATQVYFDGKIANSLTVEDPGTITLKTPPHDPGAVAVDVIRGEHSDSLIDGFTYFSPTNPQGGTYGSPLQGTLNVTVLNIYTLKPVAQAFVQVGQPGQPGFPKYSGYTDDGGQIVFSGNDVQPPMTVSATKPQFSASSIVNFEVGNATLLLFPWTPPSSGPGTGGPGLPLATLKGTVLDIDKYMLTPPTNCLKPSTGGPLCDFCTEDIDCKNDSTGGDPTTWACIQTGGVSARCFNICQSNADCKTDFTCALDVVDGSRKVCRPSTGIREITCQTSTRGLDTENPPPGPGMKVDEKTGAYEITSRLDELAVYCVGGYRRNDGTFQATAMGVRRHIFPQPGQVVEGLDIQLNIPLRRTLPVRLDHPQHFHPAGNGGDLALDGWINLGSDGYVSVAKVGRKAEKLGETGVLDSVLLVEQPLTLPVEMTDTTYTWRVVVDFGKGATPSPMEAGTQHANVVRPGDDNLLVRSNGAWLEQQVGVHTTLVAALPGEATDVLLTARDGRIFRGAAPDLYLIWLPGIVDPYAQPAVVLAAAGTPTDATLVGEDGLIRRLQPGPQGPEVTLEKSAIAGHLRAVCHGALGRVIVGDAGALQVNTGGIWTKVPSGTNADLRSVVCTPTGAVAVGANGAVVAVAIGGAVLSAQTTTVKDPSGAAAGLFGVARSAKGVFWAAGRTAATSGNAGVLLTSADGLAWTSGWPAGTKGDKIPALRRLAVVAEGTLMLADEDGGLWQRTPLGLTNESLQRRNVLPMAIAVLETGTTLVVGEPGLWLGPFLTVPTVTRPLDGTATKSMKVEWAVAPGPTASVSRVHIDGQGFPFWWLYLDPLSTSIALPDFQALENITVFPPIEVPFVARVDRIFAPELSINGFSTFDLEFGDWRSWSTNGKTFTFKQ